MKSTAANYLAARQALYFKDFKASADFYLTALNFDRNNADLLKAGFYTQYQLGNIDAAATLAVKWNYKTSPVDLQVSQQRHRQFNGRLGCGYDSV